MSEQESKPQSSKQSGDDKIEALEIVLPDLAEQEAENSPPVSDLAEKEAKVLAGESQDSDVINQFAYHEEQTNFYKLQNDQLKIINKQKELQNRALENKINEDEVLDTARRDYTFKLFLLTVGWLLIVVLFVLGTGLKTPRFNSPNCTDCVAFNLSDNVLIAFITSTTATVIGIFVVVARWLFPSKEQKEQKEETEKKSK